MKHSKDYIQGYTAALRWVTICLDSELFSNDIVRDALHRGLKKVKEMEDE